MPIIATDFWLVPPSLVLFVGAGCLAPARLAFWVSLGTAILSTVACYLLLFWMRRAGVIQMKRQPAGPALILGPSTG